jgi:ankyrin repeat protein
MGADPNIKATNRWTALHEAVLWINLKAAILLVEAGADSSIKDDEHLI